MKRFVVCGTVLVLLMGGLAAAQTYTLDYTKVQDAFAQSQNPGTNYGAQATTWAGYYSGAYYRGLVKFDLSGIDMSGGKAVTSATLSLTTQGSTAVYTASLSVYVGVFRGIVDTSSHPVITDWNESQVTFGNSELPYDNTTNWSMNDLYSGNYGGPPYGPWSDGMDFQTTPTAYANVPASATNVWLTETVTVSFDVTADAKAWLEQGKANHGWLVRTAGATSPSLDWSGSSEGTATGIVGFFSKETAGVAANLKPTLVVVVGTPSAQAPTITPNGGTFVAPWHVTLASTTPGATIYYTTNGATPDNNTSTLYSGSFALNASATVKAITYASGYSPSTVTSATFTMANAATLTLDKSLANDVFVDSQNSGNLNNYSFEFIGRYSTGDASYRLGLLKFDLSSLDMSGGKTVRSATLNMVTSTAYGLSLYTMNGGPVYLGFFRGIADPTGLVDTDWKEAEATYSYSKLPYGNGTLWCYNNPNGSGGYGPPYYPANDGMDFLTTPSTVVQFSVPVTNAWYAAAIPFTVDVTPDAKAWLENGAVNHGWMIRTPTNDAGNDWAGTPVTGQFVAFNSHEAAGDTPNLVIQLGPPLTATPSFSPDGGTYDGTQTVTIACSTPGASISYTTDGSDPSQSHGTVVSSGATVSITASMTLKAMAWASGADPSGIKSAVYTITTKAPMFSPPGGLFILPQQVTLSCQNAGATIRYTTDNSTPDNASAIYSSEISVSDNATLKAKAWSPGLDPSPVTTAVFQFPASFNRPATVPCGSAVIDGDLSEWDPVTFVPLDQNYDSFSYDVAQAYYAARWSADGSKLYVAVKVDDTDHFFTNSYTAWNGRDAVEIYVHTTSTGSVSYFGTQDTAQQYTMGIMAGNPNAVWATIGNAVTIPSSAGFTAAGKVVGEWIYYEAAITPFQYFGGIAGGSNVASTLHTSDVVGLDVDVVARDSVGYTGMKSENMMQGKYNDYTKLGIHRLGYTASDLAAILVAMDSTSADPAYTTAADLDGDGEVTSSDLAMCLAGMQ